MTASKRAKVPEHVVVSPRWYPFDSRERVTICLPGLKTVNELNRRDHWTKTRGANGLGTGQRLAAKGAVDGWMSDPSHRQEPAPPYVVTLTRWAPGVLDDDGLRAALKRVRDGVAEGLGLDDGPTAPIEWRYAHRREAFSKSPRLVRYAVDITIAWQEAPGGDGGR